MTVSAPPPPRPARGDRATAAGGAGPPPRRRGADEPDQGGDRRGVEVLEPLEVERDRASLLTAAREERLEEGTEDLPGATDGDPAGERDREQLGCAAVQLGGDILQDVAVHGPSLPPLLAARPAT